MEVLYRFFDSEDKLLYVGISSNWQQRLKQHYKDSEFYWETVNITLEHYDRREDVEAAEIKAIQTEGPKYNKAYNPNFEDATKHLTRLKYWVYSDLIPDAKHVGVVEELRSLYLLDSDWEKKTAGPISYYLLEMLPVWANKYDVDCSDCINAWHSQQIITWAESFKGKKCR
jgi:predicted GIY-YIG superfamily endonuclease